MKAKAAGPRRRGFTLVEALAALALIAIVLPVAMRGISLATAAASAAAERERATLLAESKLAELVATGAWRESPLEGDFQTDEVGVWMDSDQPVRSAEGYRWSAEVEDWYETSVRRLEVRVSWASRGREREVALTTLIRAEEQQG